MKLKPLLRICSFIAVVHIQAFEGNGPALKQVLANAYYPQDEDAFYTQFHPKFQQVLYGLEKLDFLLHKELSNLFYTRYKKKDLFILAGFNNLQQGHCDKVCGFNIKDSYQALGGMGDVKSLCYLGSLGLAESKIHIHPATAKAYYNTLWGAWGLKKRADKWQFGFDLVGGYSQINSSKDISEVSLKMKGDNHAFFGSIEGKGSYKIVDDTTSLEPYDALSLFYSYESSYCEKGDPRFALKIKDENLWVIRNELGFYLNIPCTKAVDLFIDPSWVYEYKLNDASYKVGQQNNNCFYTIETMYRLPRNYGRLNAGFYIKGRKIDLAITYIGLWATKFSSAATSLKLDLKF